VAHGGVGGTDVGHEVGRRLREPAQDLGERQVGQRAVAEVEAVADQRAPAGPVRAVAELAQQPGLPDPGVAGQQQSAGHGRGADPGQPGELVELVVTADERVVVE
jgi:hypothetical protein